MTVFASAVTQWQVSPVGLIGLRYEALPVLMEAAGVPPEHRPALMDDLRDMEAEALKLLAQRRR